MKKPLAALLTALALLAPASAAHSQTVARTFEGRYAVYARGIEAGVFTFTFSQTGATYQASADRRMTGLVAALAGRNQDYTYSVRGAVVEGALHPSAYQHQGGRRREDRPNGRLVRASFTPSDVTTVSEPAGMGMGDPPATAEQKRNVIDQLTAIAAMITASGDPCARTLRVYMDARSRFDFVLSPNGRVEVDLPGFEGDAIRCRVQFRPIAGFSDPQEPGELTFLFAPTPSGLFAPVQIEMPTNDAGVVRLQARSLRVNGAAVN